MDKPCRTCKGHGTIEWVDKDVYEKDGKRVVHRTLVIETCPKCNGTGTKNG